MKIYECNECKKHVTDLQSNEWIELGGKDKSFFFVNFNKENKNAYSNWGYLHFCGEKCFTKFFLNKP